MPENSDVPEEPEDLNVQDVMFEFDMDRDQAENHVLDREHRKKQEKERKSWEREASDPDDMLFGER